MCLEPMITPMTKYIYIAIKRRTGKQFIDFLKRVEKRYDKNIQKYLSCT